MKQINEVAAMPGLMMGTMTLRSVRISPAPSRAAASKSSTGMSARKERIIHTAIGRFIAVYKISRELMLSSRPRYLAKMYSGSRPATAGSILVDRKKNMASVHFLIGRTDSAYAAGIASRITRIVEMIEAVAELINGGHGLAPEEAPKNSR